MSTKQQQEYWRETSVLLLVSYSSWKQLTEISCRSWWQQLSSSCINIKHLSSLRFTNVSRNTLKNKNVTQLTLQLDHLVTTSFPLPVCTVRDSNRSRYLHREEKTTIFRSIFLFICPERILSSGTVEDLLDYTHCCDNYSYMDWVRTCL